MRPSPVFSPLRAPALRRAAPRLLCTLALAPLLMAATCNPHRKKGGGEDVVVVDDLPPPSQKLAVGGVDPATGPADRVFPVEVFGSGFERGATVSFSNADGSGARVTGDNSITVDAPALAAGVYDVIVKNPDGGKAVLRRGLTVKDAADTSACTDFSVYFAVDSSVVEPAMRPQLEALAACARTGGATVRVEGNCDHTGTTEYNLALGQRRAEAITRYLQSLGVPAQKLRAVSYGEERPAATGSDAASQARNRRADIHVQE